LLPVVGGRACALAKGAHEFLRVVTGLVVVAVVKDLSPGGDDVAGFSVGLETHNLGEAHGQGDEGICDDGLHDDDDVFFELL